LSPVVSLVSVHYLRLRAGLVELAQCQFKVTGWVIMFICGMVLRCPGSGFTIILNFKIFLNLRFSLNS